MRTKPTRSVSEYVQGERYVHVSPLPGPWDGDVTPHLAGIMDAFSQEHVREIFVAGGSQGGKTDLTHNCWAWSAVYQPGPALIVMQDKISGSEVINDRFIPMIKDTPSLRKLRTKNPDDLSLSRVRLRNGMVTYLAWSNSEGRLASKPIKILIMSEVDLYPELSIRKARARTRAFRYDRKIMEECTTSTENGRIWQAQKFAQECRDFYAVCPHCGHEQTIVFEGIRWAEGVTDPVALTEKGTAWYECESCRKPWDEEDRNDAVRAGRKLANGGWRRRENGKPQVLRPSTIWFHVPPLLSQFVTFSEVAAAYLTTLVEPTVATLKYFYNDCLGLPTPEDSEGEILQEKDLYARREAYAPEGVKWNLPMSALVVTAFTDVQDDRLECEARAWGIGNENWGLGKKTFHGPPAQQDVWDQLHDYIQGAEWLHESGSKLRIVASGIDTGGHHTQEAYKFSKRSSRYYACKGSNIPAKPLISRPAKTKAKVPLYLIGTEGAKDSIYGWLTVTKSGPRCCHFSMTHDFEYFKELVSERAVNKKDAKGRPVRVYVVRDGYKRNEALDIFVGNLAILERLNPNMKKLAKNLRDQCAVRETKEAPEPEKELEKPIEKVKRPIRVPRRGGFVKGWKN
jgi:phage terminase large subunit GpA-like protein